MKKVKLDSYRTDKYYPRIVRAVHELLDAGAVVTPIDVFLRMGLLAREDVENWRFGRVPCLEMLIRCNLSCAGRILRILRMHAHDLHLKPSQTVYTTWGQRPRRRLRFSKSGEPNIEEAYSRHFLRPGKQPAQPTVEEAAPCGDGGVEGKEMLG